MGLDYFAEIVKLALAQRRLENGAALELVEPLRVGFGQLLDVIGGKQVVKVADPRALMPDAQTYRLIQSEIDDLVVSTAQEVSRRFAAIVKRQAGEQLDALPPGRARQLYESITINGHTIAEHLDVQRRSLRERLLSDMRRAVHGGESFDALRDRISSNCFGTAIAQANALLRTAVNTMSSLLIYETAAKNSGQFFSGYYLAVILDGRTSKVCMGYAAERRLYEFKGTAPKPPFHFNCRTTILPVWHGFAGAIPEDGDAWLRSQSHEVQNDILGKRLAEKYRSGKLPLSRLAKDEVAIDVVSEHRRTARKVTLGIDVNRLSGMLNERGRARLAQLVGR